MDGFNFFCSQFSFKKQFIHRIVGNSYSIAQKYLNFLAQSLSSILSLTACQNNNKMALPL